MCMCLLCFKVCICVCISAATVWLIEHVLILNRCQSSQALKWNILESEKYYKLPACVNPASPSVGCECEE